MQHFKLKPLLSFFVSNKDKRFQQIWESYKKKNRSRDFLSLQMITLIQSSGIKPAQYVGFLKSHINFKDTNLMADWIEVE